LLAALFALWTGGAAAEFLPVVNSRDKDFGALAGKMPALPNEKGGSVESRPFRWIRSFLNAGRGNSRGRSGFN
jgi:hypothetical protein